MKKKILWGLGVLFVCLKVSCIGYADAEVKEIILSRLEEACDVDSGINCFGSAEVEIRMITPPKLEESNKLEKVLCHRPMRLGVPKMELETLRSKVIVHDYGHGGSGWTLAPGAAEYCVALYEKYLGEEIHTQINKDAPVVVLGAGVIGLFTALELKERGFTQVRVIADQFENLASHNAGGLIAPVSVKDNPELQKIVDTIGIESYRFYRGIAEGRHSLFSKGARLMPVYSMKREASSFDSYVSSGVMMAPKDVILDFQNGVTRRMVAFDDSILVDTFAMIRQLRALLEDRNVQFLQKHINDFDEIEEAVIFNCAGLGAKELTNDADVYSAQGHLILLKDQNPEDLQYMVCADGEETVNELGQRVVNVFYMFPKIVYEESGSVGVVGGTFIKGATEETPNVEQFDVIWKLARQFYGLEL